MLKNERDKLREDFKSGFSPSPLKLISILDFCDKQDARIDRLEAALEKIADPRKRDHKEPDDYTEKCCLMHIAYEALAKHEPEKLRGLHVHKDLIFAGSTKEEREALTKGAE